MLLVIISFLSGILTVLSPCTLVTLPIILGGTLKEKKNSRTLIILTSFAFSLLIFTLLLKITTIFINIPPIAWQLFSGILIILMGINFLFPNLWIRLVSKISIGEKTQQLLLKHGKNNSLWGNIITGFALGPIFSSCSPTYSYILISILPKGTFVGLVNICAYIFGFVLIIALISIFSKNVLTKLKILIFGSKLYSQILGLTFIIIGILVSSGFDKNIEAYMIGILQCDNESSCNPFIYPLLFEKKILENYIVQSSY